MIHEGQVKKYYELVETCAQKLQRNRRTTMCAVLAKCTFHKLKRSWPRTTSRRLGSYSTFSTNASNSRLTSSVDIHSLLDKHIIRNKMYAISLQLLGPSFPVSGGRRRCI